MKESQNPPKLPPKESQKEIKERQKEIRLPFGELRASSGLSFTIFFAFNHP